MKKYTIPIFLAGTLFMVYIMAKTGASLKTSSTPHGIIDLEFAYSTAKTTFVINAWAPANNIDNIAAAKFNTWLDFIFIFFYTSFLFFASKKIAQTFKGTVAKAGYLIAKAVLLAGFLDILENSGMLLTLNGHTSGSIAFCTTFCSVIKWALVITVVLYVLNGALVLAYRKIKG